MNYRLDNHTLASCARDYIEARDQGDPNAYQSVAEKYDKSVSTIAVWLRHARSRGLLTPYVSKSNWGELTDKGRRAIKGGPVKPQRDEALDELKALQSRRARIEKERESLDLCTRNAVLNALDLGIPFAEISSALGQNRSALWTKYRADIKSNSTTT